MKVILLVLSFGLSLPSFAQQSDDYKVDVHVINSRITSICGSVFHGESTCKWAQTLTTTIDGHKYELQSETLRSKGVVALGDYKAKLVKDETRPTGEFNRVYDLMFPDQSTRKFKVVGQME